MQAVEESRATVLRSVRAMLVAPADDWGAHPQTAAALPMAVYILSVFPLQRGSFDRMGTALRRCTGATRATAHVFVRRAFRALARTTAEPGWTLHEFNAAWDETGLMPPVGRALDAALQSRVGALLDAASDAARSEAPPAEVRALCACITAAFAARAPGTLDMIVRSWRRPPRVPLAWVLDAVAAGVGQAAGPPRDRPVPPTDADIERGMGRLLGATLPMRVHGPWAWGTDASHPALWRRTHRHAWLQLRVTAALAGFIAGAPANVQAALREIADAGTAAEDVALVLGRAWEAAQAALVGHPVRPKGRAPRRRSAGLRTATADDLRQRGP
jgi:hypothetical protein